MTEWKEYKLSDIGTIVGGATPSTKDASNYDDGEIAWLTPKDLSAFTERYISRGERNITERGFKSSSTQMLPVNTVLFSSRAPIGYVAIAANEMCTNQGFKSIIPNSKVDYLFLYYLLKYKKNAIEGMGSGTTFKEVSGNVMKNIEVQIPTDINIQKKIADVLDKIDSKIENNTAINRNLSEQAQALYKSWFVDLDPFEGERPADWQDGTVDDLASEVVCGKTPSTKREEYYGNDVPFVTIPDMHGCVYTVHTGRSLSELGAESQSKKTLPKNSICISCIGTAGLVTLLPVPSQTNQQINSIIPKNNYSPYYIYLLMSTMGETINKLGQAGSTIVNLNKTQFGKMEVLIPSIKTMSDFDEIVEPIFSAILSNQIENKKLANLRDILLPKLMSGEIDVSDLEI